MPKSSSNVSSITAKKVPRPMNCFLAFRLEKQNEIVARCPGANHRDISKIIAKYWKETSEEEKEPYRRRAYLAKLEHEKLYPGYKYQPQKKNGRKTRKYERKVKDTFTSRNQGNNRMMEIFYKNPRLLDDDNNGDSKTAFPSPEYQTPGSMCAMLGEETYSAMGNASVAPTTPSPLMSDVNSPMTTEEPTLSYNAYQDVSFVINPLFPQQSYAQSLSYTSMPFHEVTGFASAPAAATTDYEAAAAAAMPALDTTPCAPMPFNYTYFDPLSFYTHPMNSCIDPQLLTCEEEILCANAFENSSAKQFKQGSHYSTYETYYSQL